MVKKKKPKKQSLHVLHVSGFVISRLSLVTSQKKTEVSALMRRSVNELATRPIRIFDFLTLQPFCALRSLWL